MKRIMMLALAVCLPFTQACEDTPQIKKKALWVCQHAYVYEEVHALYVYPEAHPIGRYVVDEDVAYTQRDLDEKLEEARGHGKGWDVGMERVVVAAARVAAARSSCQVTSMKRVEYGKRYRVTMQLDYEMPKGTAPYKELVREDISSMVPPLDDIEKTFAKEWDRDQVLQKRRAVEFDMVRTEGNTWKAELDLRVDRGEPKTEVVTDRRPSSPVSGGMGGDEPGPDDEVPEPRAEKVEERVTDAWKEWVEQARKQRVEPKPAPRAEDPKEEAMKRRIEALEREVRDLKRERQRYEYRNDNVDIEITW